MANKVYNCLLHDKGYHLECQSVDNRRDICCQCCQHILSSTSESDSKHKIQEVLALIEDCLLNGSKLVITSKNSKNFEESFLMSITEYVFDSNPIINNLAKNCLKYLLFQISHNTIDSIYGEIIINMNSLIFKNQMPNESTVELLAELIKLSPIPHFRREDFDILIESFQNHFFRVNDKMKKNLLKLFKEKYLKSEDLFDLNEEFHRKTLEMLFNTFDGFSKSKDSDLKLVSIELLNLLSKIQSILKYLISNKKFIKYLRTFLSEKCDRIKTLVIDWICDLLIDENMPKMFISIFEKEMMDSLIDLLISTDNNLILEKLLQCLTLVLRSTQSKNISPSKLESMFSNLIKSMEISVDKNDDKLFKISLAALVTVSRKKSKIQVMDEFDFFTILDLLELRISSPNLFPFIVNFFIEMFDPKTVPVIIPTQRMKTILDEVLKNIMNTNDSKECISRTTCAVGLIKSFMNLIDSIKEKEFHSSEEEVALDVIPFLNTENADSLNEFNLEEFSQTNNSNQTETYDILNICLENLEIFLTNILTELSNDDNLEENSKLFQIICNCFEVMFEKDLFVESVVYRFLIKMFSDGTVLSLLNLLWFSELPVKSVSFKTQLSSVLSHFLFKIQVIEYQNDYRLKYYGKVFDITVIKKAIYECNGLELSRFELRGDNSEGTQYFFRVFFALNYYCFKFNSKENYSMDRQYEDMLYLNLNSYLFYNFMVEDHDFESILTIKHLLFLFALCDKNHPNFDLRTFDKFRQLFQYKDIKYLSNYYTNHIILLKWLFNELKCDEFSKYGLQEFLKSIDDYNNFDEKNIISSFFELINSNDSALQLFVDNICEIIENDSTRDVIQLILEDSEYFVDDCDIHQNWINFCQKIFQKTQTIIRKIADKIKSFTDSKDTNIPDIEKKITYLLNFLLRLLSNQMNCNDYECFGKEFLKLLHQLTQLIDKQINNSSLQTIFKFFRTCVTSDSSGKTANILSGELLTDSSKTSVILLFDCIHNDSAKNTDKETALYLLSVLSQNKCKNKISHNFVYELDINLLIDSLNSESEVETKSGFNLLKDCFEIKSYFSSDKKNTKIKFVEMRQLLLGLQNAIFRRFISFSELSQYLNRFFNDLKQISLDFCKELVKSRLFSVIIKNYMNENPLKDNEEIIDLLLIFVNIKQKDFINQSLVQIINDLTEKIVKTIESLDRNNIYIEKDLIFLKAIYFGIYSNQLNNKNSENLNKLSENPKFIDDISLNTNQNIEHNYCRLEN